MGTAHSAIMRCLSQEISIVSRCFRKREHRVGTFGISTFPRLFATNVGNSPGICCLSALGVTFVRRGDDWGHRWFEIHEPIAAIVWFAIGWSLDVHWLRVRRAMIGYLCIRVVLIALFAIRNRTGDSYTLQTLWWFWFFGYLIFAASRSILRRTRAARGSVAQA